MTSTAIEKGLEQLVRFAIENKDKTPGDQKEWNDFSDQLHELVRVVRIEIDPTEEILQYLEEGMGALREHFEIVKELNMDLAKIHEFDTIITDVRKKLYDITRMKARFAKNWYEFRETTNDILRELAALNVDETAGVLDTRKQLVFAFKEKIEAKREEIKASYEKFT